MSTDEVPISDLERGPSASWKGAEIGHTYSGTVMWSRRAPQTDIDTGEILKWNDGNERMQTLVGLDIGKGETTTLYARGGNYTPEVGEGESLEGAIVSAVRAAGDDRIRKGARLTVTYTGHTKPARKGISPARLFTAKYEPPVEEAAIGDLFSDDEAEA